MSRHRISRAANAARVALMSGSVEPVTFLLGQQAARRNALLASAVRFGTMVQVRRMARKYRWDQQEATSCPEEGFNLLDAQRMTEEFGGAQMSLKSLEGVVGPGSQFKPAVKLGGEDDIFLADSPRGHVYYAMPTEDTAQIWVIMPKEGYQTELQEVLDEATPKYVITDLITGDEYATRDPLQAQQFARALGSDGDLRRIWIDDFSWDEARKPVPEMLFA